jgi:hypothetical protein
MKASLMEGAAPQPTEESARMSRPQFWGVLAIALTLFLFEAGPIWRHPWDMELLNRAIFWSYVAIPLLVIGCLAWSRRLTPRVFIVDTLVLVLVKYTCTFAFALVLWELTPFPSKAHQAELPHGARSTAVELAPAATRIDPAKTGAVSGLVTDAAGRPLEGALVWIAGGLEDYVFAAPSTPVTLARADVAAPSPLTVVQVNQPILARSEDGRLHTLIAVRDGKTLFNTPLLASGEPSHASFREAEGLVTLRCNVHQGGSEAEAQILVVGHPFFTRTDASGRFALHGVPAARVQLAATLDGRPGAERAVDITPQGNAELTLAFDAPQGALAATLR